MILAGRVAFVTGAGRGIGREIAITLSGAGARVACASSSPGGCQDTVGAAKEGALALQCDVAQYDQVEAAVEQTLSHFGRLDILVSNAGTTADQVIVRMSDEHWNRVLDVNLKGAFHCIKAAVKPMVKARYGRIITISSIIGISGGAGQANYAASKAGLIGLTKSVAKEFGSRGITCNAIAPGFIETDMTRELPEEKREHVRRTAPLGRLGTPADVAAAALFLAGEGSAYITGQVLIVDGGLTL